MTLLVLTIVVALAFDFTNGFHDTANAVATSISTRALSPRLAVLIASIANLCGVFVTTAVASTIGKGIIDSNLATEQTVLAAVPARSSGTSSPGGSACRRRRPTL